MEENAYYVALGIPEGALDFSFHRVMVSSVFALPLILCIGLVAFLSWEAGPKIRRRSFRRPRLHPVYVITFCATIAFFAGFALREGTADVWLGSPREYWIAMAIAAGGILVGSQFMGFARQPSRPGAALLVVLSLMLVSVTGGFMGMNRASNMESGCEFRTMMTFDPKPANLPDDRYWLLAQQGQVVWLRVANATENNVKATFVEIPAGMAVHLDREKLPGLKCP